MSIRILCFGDSNTWGYCPSNGSRIVQRWTKVLETHLPEAEVIEEGLNGRTAMHSEPFGPEKSSFDSFTVALLSHKPLDVIILMLGSNDLKKEHNVSAFYLCKGMQEFIKAAQNPWLWTDSQKQPLIILVAPPALSAQAIVTYPESFNEASLIESKRIAGFYKTVASQEHVVFFDAGNVVEVSSVDGLHLEEENHIALGLALKEKVQSLLFPVEES